MTDIVGNLAGDFLEPLKDAEHVLAEVLDRLGAGIQWTGREVAELADTVDGMADKVAQIQAKLRGGAQ